MRHAFEYTVIHNTGKGWLEKMGSKIMPGKTGRTGKAVLDQVIKGNRRRRTDGRNVIIDENRDKGNGCR
jgi:hypothetical protein